MSDTISKKDPFQPNQPHLRATLTPQNQPYFLIRVCTNAKPTTYKKPNRPIPLEHELKIPSRNQEPQHLHHHRSSLPNPMRSRAPLMLRQRIQRAKPARTAQTGQRGGVEGSGAGVLGEGVGGGEGASAALAGVGGCCFRHVGGGGGVADVLLEGGRVGEGLVAGGAGGGGVGGGVGRVLVEGGWGGEGFAAGVAVGHGGGGLTAFGVLVVGSGGRWGRWRVGGRT